MYKSGTSQKAKAGCYNVHHTHLSPRRQHSRLLVRVQAICRNVVSDLSHGSHLSEPLNFKESSSTLPLLSMWLKITVFCQLRTYAICPSRLSRHSPHRACSQIAAYVLVGLDVWPQARIHTSPGTHAPQSSKDHLQLSRKLVLTAVLDEE